jgi:hypothetical protein
MIHVRQHFSMSAIGLRMRFGFTLVTTNLFRDSLSGLMLV